MIEIFLKRGKEKLPLNRHPWIFSGAIAQKSLLPKKTEIVEVKNDAGQFIAYGQYNPSSAIAIRLMEWDSAIVIDDQWYEKKIKEALALRSAVVPKETNSYRLIFSEADGLPGFIVDRFDSLLILQALTSYASVKKDLVAKILLRLIPDCDAVYEKSDGDGRKMEGLPEVSGLLAGTLPEKECIIRENDLLFYVDIRGQKTGFYCDQRENRAHIASIVQKGDSVLDCCCYSGSFGIQALKKGARSVLFCDSSEQALELVKKNIALNKLDISLCTFICGDAFTTLRELVKEKQVFDIIILDPPKLAPTKKDVPKSLRAYKDLNMHALLLARKYLATFSCSGLVSSEQFTQTVAWAMKDTQKRVHGIHRYSQAACHPFLLSFPESEYLKGILCKSIHN